jgi:hypothetical protein
MFLFQDTSTLATIAKVAGIASAVVAVMTVIATRTIPWIWAKVASRTVSKRIGADLYSPAQVARSIQYYIRPDFQDVDPAGADEPRMVYGARQPLFEALDDAFSRRTEYRYLILLADSGMGKTSGLINYYVRHLRRIRPYRLVILPLNVPDVDERIKAIENKSNTVLILDALDEDTLAIVDHRARVRDLVGMTREFEKVLISCRTQFFGKDEEIPARTGIIVVGSRAAGESAEHRFHKLYISPFSPAQVEHYIKRLYPVWFRKRRQKARELAAKIPSLSARPMLLAHFNDLVRATKSIRYAYELYEEMINAWIQREDGFINDAEQLRRFSELLAVDLFVHREMRGAERIPREEINDLATKWGISIEDWKLSGRSLLNRDAEGNFKFAHRSIMEYLYVISAIKGNMACRGVPWTDQMREFLKEMVIAGTAIPVLRWNQIDTNIVFEWLNLTSPVDKDSLAQALVFIRWVLDPVKLDQLVLSKAVIRVEKGPLASVQLRRVGTKLGSWAENRSHGDYVQDATLQLMRLATKRRAEGELFVDFVQRSSHEMVVLIANTKYLWEVRLGGPLGTISNTAAELIPQIVSWAEGVESRSVRHVWRGDVPLPT